MLGAANPNEGEETLLRNTEQMAKEGFYLVKSVLRHCYCQGCICIFTLGGVG